jgi:two-component system, chemotaxis family, chemotaxis protein CheY
LAKVKAFIAEDERAMRLMIRRMLQQLGVESREMGNGLELVTALEEESCDADFAVIDIEMPILNGIETLRAIRSSPKYRDMPVVCVSSVTDHGVINEMIGMGLSDYLLKPLRPEVAIPRLRNILRPATQWRK